MNNRIENELCKYFKDKILFLEALAIGSWIKFLVSWLFIPFRQ